MLAAASAPLKPVAMPRRRVPLHSRTCAHSALKAAEHCQLGPAASGSPSPLLPARTPGLAPAAAAAAAAAACAALKLLHLAEYSSCFAKSLARCWRLTPQVGRMWDRRECMAWFWSAMAWHALRRLMLADVVVSTGNCGWEAPLAHAGACALSVCRGWGKLGKAKVC